jgi:hypothetical protein
MGGPAIAGPPYTLMEMKMTGYPSDEEVYVSRGLGGSQVHCFMRSRRTKPNETK